MPMETRQRGGRFLNRTSKERLLGSFYDETAPDSPFDDHDDDHHQQLQLHHHQHHQHHHQQQQQQDEHVLSTAGHFHGAHYQAGPPPSKPHFSPADVSALVKQKRRLRPVITYGSSPSRHHLHRHESSRSVGSTGDTSTGDSSHRSQYSSSSGSTSNRPQLLRAQSTSSVSSRKKSTKKKKKKAKSSDMDRLALLLAREDNDEEEDEESVADHISPTKQTQQKSERWNEDAQQAWDNIDGDVVPTPTRPSRTAMPVDSTRFQDTNNDTFYTTHAPTNTAASTSQPPGQSSLDDAMSKMASRPREQPTTGFEDDVGLSQTDLHTMDDGRRSEMKRTTHPSARHLDGQEDDHKRLMSVEDIAQLCRAFLREFLDVHGHEEDHAEEISIEFQQFVRKKQLLKLVSSIKTAWQNDDTVGSDDQGFENAAWAKPQAEASGIMDGPSPSWDNDAAFPNNRGSFRRTDSIVPIAEESEHDLVEDDEASAKASSIAAPSDKGQEEEHLGGSKNGFGESDALPTAESADDTCMSFPSLSDDPQLSGLTDDADLQKSADKLLGPFSETSFWESGPFNEQAAFAHGGAVASMDLFGATENPFPEGTSHHDPPAFKDDNVVGSSNKDEAVPNRVVRRQSSFAPDPTWGFAEDDDQDEKVPATKGTGFAEGRSSVAHLKREESSGGASMSFSVMNHNHSFVRRKRDSRHNDEDEEEEQAPLGSRVRAMSSSEVSLSKPPADGKLSLTGQPASKSDSDIHFLYNPESPTAVSGDAPGDFSMEGAIAAAEVSLSKINVPENLLDQNASHDDAGSQDSSTFGDEVGTFMDDTSEEEAPKSTDQPQVHCASSGEQEDRKMQGQTSFAASDDDMSEGFGVPTTYGHRARSVGFLPEADAPLTATMPLASGEKSTSPSMHRRGWQRRERKMPYWDDESFSDGAVEFAKLVSAARGTNKTGATLPPQTESPKAGGSHDFGASSFQCGDSGDDFATTDEDDDGDEEDITVEDPADSPFRGITRNPSFARREKKRLAATLKSHPSENQDRRRKHGVGNRKDDNDYEDNDMDHEEDDDEAARRRAHMDIRDLINSEFEKGTHLRKRQQKKEEGKKDALCVLDGMDISNLVGMPPAPSPPVRSQSMGVTPTSSSSSSKKSPATAGSRKPLTLGGRTVNLVCSDDDTPLRGNGSDKHLNGFLKRMRQRTQRRNNRLRPSGSAGQQALIPSPSQSQGRKRTPKNLLGSHL